MLSLGALALFLFATAAVFAGKLWAAVLSGAAGFWLALQAMKRRDDMELLFGLFLGVIVLSGVIRLLVAVLP